MLAVLDQVGLTDDFLDMGPRWRETMVELFADLPPGHEFFEQFSFISAEDLPEFQAIAGAGRQDGVDSLTPDERTRLLALPFKLIEARHRLGLIDEPTERRMLEARQAFAPTCPSSARRVEFFDPPRYNAAATIQDNILFGKVAYGQAQAGGGRQADRARCSTSWGCAATVSEVGLDTRSASAARA